MTNKEIDEKKEKKDSFLKEREKLEFRLRQFRRNLKSGFSDNNFSVMAYDYNKLSSHLSLKDLQSLGSLWSLSYTTDIPIEVIEDTINEILENY